MQLDNGVEMKIKKSWYNRSHVSEDGVTHIIDTEHNYPVYQFGMAKNYFDIEDKTVVVEMIISDLKSTIEKLQQMVKQDRENNIERED